MITCMIMRPITPVEKFEEAIRSSRLSDEELEIVEHIRYTGVFNQVTLSKSLRLKAKPPALTVICNICRKIGKHMPKHLALVREWSKKESEYGVHWDGNLICSIAWNSDGERLTPESGTSQYHTFAVHKELFQGLEM